MLKKNSLLLSLGLCLLAANVFAQDASESSISSPWQLKVQANYSLSRFESPNPRTGNPPSVSTQASRNLSFPYLSVAKVSQNGNFQEVSLNLSSKIYNNENQLGSNDELRDNRDAFRGIGLSYRYAFQLIEAGRFRAYAAARAGVSLNYYRSSQSSSGGNTSENRSTSLSLGLGVEPIVQWDLNDRLFLEASLPINLISGGVGFLRNKTPFTGNDWENNFSTNYQFSPFRNITARFGLGIRL